MDKRPVFAVATSAVLPSGLSLAKVWESIAAGESAVRPQPSVKGTYWGARFDQEQEDILFSGLPDALSAFEVLAAVAVEDALKGLAMPPDPGRTLFVLSTTKGDIAGLGIAPDERISLSASAAVISAYTGFSVHRPQVISHACISGVAALMFGMRQLQAGLYDHAVVVGADQLTPFVLSGFQSFQAIAPEQCRPFDKDRKGINLGEGAAAIILSTANNNAPLARLCSAATTNDANHISGPSRTGAELGMAISRALSDAGISGSDIDALSAHGTATLYNDEMESKAFALAGVSAAPVHSIKACTGHTLGTAGIVESALLIESIRRGELLPSVGYSEHGVSEPLNVTRVREKKTIRYALKTASGFGGCNAAAVWAAP